jgi:hypothetical protein
LKIIAYEFYFHNALNGYQFVGILPERRKDPRRITKRSIKKLGRKITGRTTDSEEVFFTQVTIDRDTEPSGIMSDRRVVGGVRNPVS